MSDAKSVINKFYLKKSEINTEVEVKITEEVKPITVARQLPVAFVASVACAKTGVTLRKNDVMDLARYLEHWYLNKGSAVQLDGRSHYKNNPAPWVYFEHQGSLYKLAGDTKDWAVKTFIDLAFANQATGTVLVPAIGKKGNPVLRLACNSKAEGWYCTKG